MASNCVSSDGMKRKRRGVPSLADRKDLASLENLG